LKAETLREVPDTPDIAEDVKRWQEQKETTLKEVESKFSGDAARKEKQDLFADIEQKLQKGGKEDKKSPLDDLFKEDPKS
jgi:hypothetical protein